MIVGLLDRGLATSVWNPRAERVINLFVSRVLRAVQDPCGPDRDRSAGPRVLLRLSPTRLGHPSPVLFLGAEHVIGCS